MWNVCRSFKCIGCLSCFYACPFEARTFELIDVIEEEVTIYVDGVPFRVPGGVSVAEALRCCEFIFGEPGGKKPWLSCGIGGCWACALVIDGVLKEPALPLLETVYVEDITPRRIAHGPSPHMVGGKGTPW